MARKPRANPTVAETKPAPTTTSPTDNATPKETSEGHPLGIVIVTH